MGTSKLIAGLLGPLLVLSGVMVLANLDLLPRLVEDFRTTPTLVVLAGYLTFIPGLAIVRFHNRWCAGWPVLVTISGWVLTIVGVLRVVLAYRLVDPATDIVQQLWPAMGPLAMLEVALGVFLSYQSLRRG
ncbi:MAG: hypothetical protein KGK11_14275 [Sphingomonadales bacterium]|nr:hypothetical protein [Sphingomonadales bacterium]